MAVREGLEQDLVLREEAGQAGHAGNRDRGDQEGPVGDRQALLQAAHVANVLLAVQRVNHRTRAEEQAGLEERVRVEVEHAGAEGAHAHRQEHVAELRHRGVGEHALDVVLHEPDSAGQERGGRAHGGNHAERDRRVLEEHRVPADHVDAGGHHRGRVNQRRHRRRAFHGVGQPGVERNLRRLASGAAEEQQRDQAERAEGHFGRHRRGLGRDDLEVERAERDERQQGAEHEQVVADAIHDERLLGRVPRRLLHVVEADEQVGTQAHALPAHEHHEEVRAEHEQQHEEHEQVQVREEPREVAVGLLVHVGRGVDVDERADAGDHQDHQRRQRVEAEGQVEREVARLDPREHGVADFAALGRQRRQGHHLRHGHGQGREHRGAGQTAGDRLGQAPAEAGVDQEAEEREERDQREHGVTT